MLQQTQVATVIPYYERFLDRFPDVQALAAAELDEVYRYWAGLGYYRRAKQLHAAACEIVTSGQVPFPRDRDAIWSLPGIGRYTASAIASFAYDARWGIVEANTQRLYARLIRCRDPLAETKTQKQLWNFAEELVQAARGSAGELNQALMEIGALVCKPVEPSCTECPLVDHCQAHRHRETHRIPAPKPKKVITPLVEIGFLISDGAGRWLLRRCLESERWAGLWDFPRFDCTQAGSDEKAIRLGAEAFAERFGVRRSEEHTF